LFSRLNVKLNVFPMDSSKTTVFQIIIAIFLPPVAILMHEGLTFRFWICCLLSLLFAFPGMIYALYVITR